MPKALADRYLETISELTPRIIRRLGKSEKKKKNYEIRTGVSGAWAGSPCSRPAFLQLV